MHASRILCPSLEELSLCLLQNQVIFRLELHEEHSGSTRSLLRIRSLDITDKLLLNTIGSGCFSQKLCLTSLLESDE